MERQGSGRATRPSQGEGTRRRPKPPLLHRARSARPPFLALLGLIAAWREVSSRDARDRLDEATVFRAGLLVVRDSLRGGAPVRDDGAFLIADGGDLARDGDRVVAGEDAFARARGAGEEIEGGDVVDELVALGA